MSVSYVKLFRAALSASLVLLCWAPTKVRAEGLFDLMRMPGHISLMRHAFAPFEGAPKEAGMDADTLGPCETQRNLNDSGRADARRIGAALRTNGVEFEHVFTSKWCRCRETAELIAGRPVDNLPLINSYYTSPAKATKGPAQIAALKAYLSQTLKPTDRVLLVTHGSLISDIASIDTGETEVVVVKADGKGGIVVIGRGVP